MKSNNKNKKGAKAKNFFSGLVEKMDKKMQEKSKSSSCCCCSPKDKSCCS